MQSDPTGCNLATSAAEWVNTIDTRFNYPPPDENKQKEFDDNCVYLSSYHDHKHGVHNKMDTLPEDDVMDECMDQDIDFTHLSHIDSHEPINMTIEEYRTKKGKLVIKQSGNKWRSCIWINIYIEIPDEWVLMYLDNSSTINALMQYLRASKKLSDAEQMFDNDNIIIYKGNYDGELCENKQDILLNGNEVIGKLDTFNFYIKSKCVKIGDVKQQLPVANTPSFILQTSSSVKMDGSGDSAEILYASTMSESNSPGCSSSFSNDIMIVNEKLHNGNGCGCIVM